MKRVITILMAFMMMMSLLPAAAQADGYQTAAFVKVTNCTLRKQPIADTGKDNKLAALENGYTMYIVGESNGYYCIQPSSVCNRDGVSLGLLDYDDTGAQQWGFVKKGHVKIGAKQYVELSQYAILYDEMIPDDEHEIGEKSKGSVHILLKIKQDEYGRRWYLVQLNEKTAGAAYVLADYAFIRQEGQAVGQTYQQPVTYQQQQTQQQQAVVVQPVVTQAPVVQTGEYEIQENGHSKLFNERALSVGSYATADSYGVAVFRGPGEQNGRFGFMIEEQEYKVLGEEGRFTIISYPFNGKNYKGYVYTHLISASNG